jgi:uncharacterized membrane protein YoaK (UPF0700 family)
LSTDARAVGERTLAGVAILLSAIAGYVDALGWTLLSHVYVANMSGNTIAVARGLARRDFGQAAARIWPIVAFTIGLFVSEIAHQIALRRGRPSSVGWTLGTEAGAIAFVSILPWPPATSTIGLDYYLPTGLLALAMGLQNATLVRVGASSVYTTHVTGNITRLAREATRAVLRMGPSGEHPVRGRFWRQRSARRALLMSGMWIAYCAGALFGALATDQWGRRAALGAVVVLTGLVIADAFEPIGGHEPRREPHPMF